MKSMVKKFIALLICIFTLTSFGDVLLWTIDDSSYVDNTAMNWFISALPEDDDNWAVGRVKITNGNGEVKYLDIYNPNPNQNLPGEIYNGTEGVWLGGNGEFYGAEWTQGVIPSDIDPATALFAIEIGMNHWIDDGTETGKINFELLAITSPHTYEQLQSFMYQQYDLNPLTATPWNPTYYSTPEPNSGILLLIGSGVLLLRRKHS